VGVAVVWQLVYLLIGQDPERYRPMMLLAVLAKGTFGIAAVVLFLQDRVPTVLVSFAAMDLALAMLFLIAWWLCRPKGNATPRP